MLPMSRDEALQLLGEHVKTPSLIKHAYCVEGAMLHFAELLGYDSEYWGMVGLLHDLDYEKYPTEHCKHTPIFLKDAGFDEDFINSVLSHGYKLCTEVEPVHPMEKIIYTVDELTGLIFAAVLVRPDKDIANLALKSVKKKFKDGAFAAAVNRELIKGGCEMLDMELDYVMEQCIIALQKVSTRLELDGSLVK